MIFKFEAEKYLTYNWHLTMTENWIFWLSVAIIMN